MMGLRSCWPRPVVLLILSLLSCYCYNLSEARHHHQKLPSAVVVGTVYCDTCFQSDVSKGSHYISGATVAVECQEGSSRPAFYQEVKTNNQGKFKVVLPFSVSKHVREIKGCNVKLVKSSEPYCAVASTASSSAIHLEERKRGKHIFSAGFFTFKPLKSPGLCNQQPSVTNSQLNLLEDLLPTPNPVEIPPLPIGPNLPLMPNLPPLPQLPPLLPPLPQLPPLPGTPGRTVPQKPTEPSKKGQVETEQVLQPQQFFPFPPIFSPPPSFLPPNPLQPPPLVPNPFQPPAPPLIPNPFQPPAPPPGLLPPMPPLPSLPPVPPLPNLPLPPVPGVTPALVPSPPPPFLPLPPVPAVPSPLLPPVLPPGVGLPIPPASVKAKKATP